MKTFIKTRGTKHLAVRTRIILVVFIPALLPIGAIAFHTWLPVAVMKYFLFTKGFVAWTLTEYIVHRWVFHENESKARARQRNRYNHHHHHSHPSDIVINKFPVRLAAYCVMLVAIVALWFGNYWITYAMGWLTGLSVYVVMHHALHQSFTIRYFPNLAIQHIWHHCKDPHKCYGVISTFWDKAFKTLPAESKLIPEKTIRFYFQHEGLDKEAIEKILRRLGHKVESLQQQSLLQTAA